MKNPIITQTKRAVYLLLTSVVGLSACNDYLDVVPKGEKIPTTLADFEALLRDEYNAHRVDVTQAILLLNDKHETDMYLSYYPLRGANYLWNESADRIALNNTDEGTYYNSYAAISSFNLILEHAPEATEATDAEKAAVIAQAKVLRAMTYFNLVNYYADTYDAATAASALAVPLITSADMGAAYTQVTIQEMYDFMLADIDAALPHLTPDAPTPLHPHLATAYALKARIYLQMSQYDAALEAAESALTIHDALFDWVAYYHEYEAQIEDPASYTPIPSPMDYHYVENFNYRHGTVQYAATENNILVARAERFEPGDARFAVRWKLRTVGADTYYASTTRGFYNYGGMTTPEVYLIKAECLARSGDVAGAMAALNAVRQTRILPEVYTPLSASTEAQAIGYIRRTKDNELILTLMPFADARRFNLEPEYARTLTKDVEGETLSLSPASHLWTMPFPHGAIKNPGNGTIVQNVER